MFQESSARLLITCPDKPGIVAAVSSFFYNHGANITELDQHSTDPEGGTFFLRLEFQTPHIHLSRIAIERAFEERVGQRYGMQWRISYGRERKRMAILASKADHALQELLWRARRGELFGEIVLVVSNHPDLRSAVEHFGIPFQHIPVEPNHKTTAESHLNELLQEQRVDLVVLARYMQVLSGEFVARYPSRIINIHHSFLPAFRGANPYKQASDRGVKLIGATAHYVTEELDVGPIIDQDVLRVSHRHSVEDLRELGQDIERTVLARAVKWHLEDRIIVHQNKTLVFS